ncbi:NYN domain-containing protein [Vibrio ulleungensis]|uniref:NYN domain-containing protein n=1 Tax=Vibrio ulleungensis TaxID=2807619 RepID=A0ABS2HLV1_9VIBR|nr:NYN domain-containing protein [Vibrio ulleungensis]MBM7038470.1 NYN domain-containing protein [Vibrio ulleungensis]
MQNVAIFVDVQNVYYTTRDAFGRHFDYNAFWRTVSKEFNIVEANAYAIASSNPKQRQFHHILRGIGFNVKLKPFIQRSDGSAKGDWDVGITIDVLESTITQQVDKIILVSGDGDFDLLAKRVQEHYGKTVDVYSVRALSAQSLIEQCTHYTAIDDSLLL